MKKSKVTRIVLIACMMISAIGIIFLESSWYVEFEKAFVKTVMFFVGKRILFSNILLGIFSSAFCMYVGECVSIYITRQNIKKEIIELNNELWPIIYIKPGEDRNSYVQVAHQFVVYQGEIKRLSQEYDRKKDKTGYIIELLNALLRNYRIIYENDTMKKNNYHLYVESLKGLSLDISEIYRYSLYDSGIMAVRKSIEEIINSFNEYQKNMDNGIDECINEIKELEKYLNKAKEI